MFDKFPDTHREAIPVARDKHGTVVAYFTPDNMTFWEAQSAAVTETHPIVSEGRSDNKLCCAVHAEPFLELLLNIN